MSEKQPVNERIQKLKAKKAAIDARIHKMEAAEKTRERKKDTRRKILVGAYYLEKARDENTWKDLVAIMDTFLKRNSDRVLFDLEPISGQ